MLNLKKPKTIYSKALQQFGIKNQVLTLCEEFGELFKCLNKIFRNGENESLIYELTDELADVEILLDQIIEYFKINRTLLNNKKKNKIKKLGLLLRG